MGKDVLRICDRSHRGLRSCRSQAENSRVVTISALCHEASHLACRRLDDPSGAEKGPSS